MSKLEKIPYLPWWMNTFWGRWMSENWPPAMALSSALKDKSNYDLAECFARLDAEKVLQSVGACIQSNFNEEFRRQLFDDFKRWRESDAEKERAAMILSRRQ